MLHNTIKERQKAKKQNKTSLNVIVLLRGPRGNLLAQHENENLPGTVSSKVFLKVLFKNNTFSTQTDRLAAWLREERERRAHRN